MNKNYIALACLAVVAAAGCNGTVPIVQNQEAIASAKTMRAYFDQSQGDFRKLSPGDQAAAEKAVGGGPADVQKMFDFMKTSNKTPVKNQ